MKVQRPRVLQRADRTGRYWFFRYWLEEPLPDGTIKASRRFHTLGPSQGPSAISQAEAEVIRDRVLAELDAAPTAPSAPAAQSVIATHDSLRFGQLAEMWRTDYVDNPKVHLAGPTRYKYRNRLEIHILPRWKNVPINQMRSKDLLDWLQAECDSWYMMLDLRNIMSGIFARAQEWEILPDAFANPMRRVKIGRRWAVWRVRGLVFFGFPLHPPGRPATKRAEHLKRAKIPMLFLQGTRDTLADLSLIRPLSAVLAPRATLHIVDTADYSLVRTTASWADL